MMMAAFENQYRGKKVLVTGHTGFKGSWMCEWLLQLGAEVHGFALDPQAHEILFDQLDLSSRMASDTRADLRDAKAVRETILRIQPDFVFHLGAQPLVRLSYEIPVETFAVNVMGTVHVLDALKDLATPCTAVMITTDKCYENREWLHSYREEDAMGGYDPYSASKGCAELAISAYRRSFFSSAHPVRIASARAGNVIGGGDWALDRIVPDCVRAIRAEKAIPVRNKVATRPWQHVLEPISGYLWLGARLAQAKTGDTQAASREQLSAGFNFGPALTSNRTVAELVQELLKTLPGEWQDASDPNALHEASKLNLAIDKAFHLLEWQPVWDFSRTLATTANWYGQEAAAKNVAEITRADIAAYVAAAREKSLAWAK